MRTKKIALMIFHLALAGLVGVGCSSNEDPGFEFMPDMYRGPSIQTYEANALFADSLSALLPAEGSIPRNFIAYEKFANTPEGYEAAKANMKMPGEFTQDSIHLVEGAKLYAIFCASCHGATGDGQGTLVKNEVFLGVPSYADREITPGSIFHVVTYGKGVMGSHASQLTPEERWKVALHVMKLDQELTGGGEEAAEDNEADAEADEGADTPEEETEAS